LQQSQKETGERPQAGKKVQGLRWEVVPGLLLLLQNSGGLGTNGVRTAPSALDTDVLRMQCLICPSLLGCFAVPEVSGLFFMELHLKPFWAYRAQRALPASLKEITGMDSDWPGWVM
jgi:hypothetical protein